MTAQILRDYVAILKEIDLESQRIKTLERKERNLSALCREVTDKVTTGKRGKKPLGTVTIHGTLDYTQINAVRDRIRRRLAIKRYHVGKLEEITEEAERFVFGIEDPEVRLLISLYCMDGHLRRWAEVAEAMGGNYTAESCRKMFKRFMQKNA